MLHRYLASAVEQMARGTIRGDALLSAHAARQEDSLARQGTDGSAASARNLGSI